MSQHDYVIDNQNGAAFRADLNGALNAVVTNNSGNTAPSATFAGMLWDDTLNGKIKKRNTSNSDWIVIGDLESQNMGLASKQGVQSQAYTSFNTTGSAGTLVVTTSPGYGALTTNQRMYLTFNVGSTGADTLNRDSTGAKLLKQYNNLGAKVTAVFATGQRADVVYDGTDYVILDSLPPDASAIPQIQTLSTPTFAGGAMTIPGVAFSLDFRSTTLANPTITRVSGTLANLVISSGSSLGTVSGVQSELVVIVMNNAGTLEYAVGNISGGMDLSETGLISTTAEGGAGAADSANVFYSTTARTNLPYRVVGTYRSTQATAGTWATAMSLIQGQGGRSILPLAPSVKAFCTFDGTTAGTNPPSSGFNVTSIVRNGTGDYTVNFSTALPSASYTMSGATTTAATSAVTVGFAAAGAGSAPTTKTTSACRITTGNASAAQDCKLVTLTFIG